ncbi:hypothetical protein K439DRAFT_1325766 [Ramaria rubella]|nr:hypothetical protein K439DRAFT_1325766 [Ramaria rubella]
MDAAKFASTFSPYTPPPDEPSVLNVSPQSSTFKPKRPWFPVNSSSHAGASYQSGGVPTFGNSMSGGLGVGDELDTPAQMWETRFGWRVDVCAAVAYLGGPITALLFLILETSNDYIRFHAYQSALLTTPILLFRILASFIFPSWLQTILTIVILILAAGMAIRAYRDATHNQLARYELPFIGELAEKWVGDE